MSVEKNYPVSETYKLLEGYDIYRGPYLIIALVVVEGNNKKDIRLYRWEKRNEKWKVDLCRMSVSKWKWGEILEKAIEFKVKYGIE